MIWHTAMAEKALGGVQVKAIPMAGIASLGHVLLLMLLTCSPPAPHVRCSAKQMQRTPRRGAVQRTAK